jgi:UDP:flavonoid glycosyltransferase YjiC (YdhE family)
MRILFAFAGGNGHFEPLVPIARAAAAVGHVVAVAGGHGMVPTIEAVGFTAFATGKPGAGAPRRIPLRVLDAERENRDLRENFARRLARERAAEMLVLCAQWKPDLVVCDELDFGSMVAAERLGLPYASVLVIAAGSFVRPRVVAEPLHELRAEHGLPPDAEMAMLHRHLVLSPFPPSFRDPACPLPPTAHAIRPFATEPVPDAPAPACIAEPSDAPTVYFTLGTVFNVECGDLFARVLAGLRDLPVNVVATVGPGIDPAELGPQPARIRIERYVPQSHLLPHCAAVVSHGGSGSVIGALAHGLPSVLLPMGADQPLNAARCADLGVGRVLDVIGATPALVREAVAAVLEDPGYRSAAERLRDEIAALPAPAHAMSLLERLVEQKHGPTDGRG